jgi:hypothetical protein
MPNLNHRFLFMVGRAFLTIGAVVALSCGAANSAIPGSECVLDIVPTSCGSSTYGAAGQRSTWNVTGCYNSIGGLGVTSFSGESLCSSTDSYSMSLEPLSDNNGKYCWCRTTSINGGAVSGRWVFASSIYDDADECADDCMYKCAFDARFAGFSQKRLLVGLGVTRAHAPVQPTNPTSCGSYTSNGPGAEGSWEVKDCSGSDVTSFTGFSRCSSTPTAGGGNPVADGGQYCWCKITSVKPNGAAAGSWLSRVGFGTASNCAQNCADQCGVYARQNNGLLRTELFSTLKTKGYACVEPLSAPTSCSGFTYGAVGQKSTWNVTGCSGGDVTSFSGESLCSSTPGTIGAPGDPDDTLGLYCWCRITNITPGGAVSSRWALLFANSTGGVSYCTNSCSKSCSQNAAAANYEYSNRPTLFNAIDW